jgi:hypothetical protein
VRGAGQAPAAALSRYAPRSLRLDPADHGFTVDPALAITGRLPAETGTDVTVVGAQGLGGPRRPGFYAPEIFGRGSTDRVVVE